MPKKPKLTPEERKALRAQKRAEKKLRKAELKKQIKRDHLEREIKYDSLTVRRHEKDWRQMLIKITVPHMKQELEFAWHNFERIVDSKDFTISLLMDEIRDAEEQYMVNFRSHVENLDYLFDLFRNQLDALNKDNLKQIDKLKTRNTEEIDDMQSGANQDMDFIKTMLYRLEIDRKVQDRNQKADYFSKLDEEEVQCQLGIQRMKGKFEQNYLATYSDMAKFVKDFNGRIKERKKEFTQLQTQDDQIQVLIGQQFKQISKSTDLIRLLRNKYNDLRQREGQKVCELESERTFFHNSFKQLKEKLVLDRRNDSTNLLALCDCCKNTLNRLEQLNTKGQNILKLTVICRKLETQKEKILPFPSFQLVATVDSEPADIDEYMHPQMDLFWQKLGQAGTLKYAIEEEKKVLIDQNSYFAHKFRQFCNKTDVPKPVFRLQGTTKK